MKMFSFGQVLGTFVMLPVAAVPVPVVIQLMFTRYVFSVPPLFGVNLKV